MRSLAATMTIFALCAAAAADEWTYRPVPFDTQTSGHNAFQYDRGRTEILGFECDDLWGYGTVYIRTSETHEAGQPDAPDVIVGFSVDGRTFEALGRWEGRRGRMFVIFDGLDDPGTVRHILERLSGARETIQLSFADRSLDFPAAGFDTAFAAASGACGW